MGPVTLHAHFDGERILLDDPYELEADAKLLVTVLSNEEEAAERQQWLRLSSASLSRAYGNIEPEYSLDHIKEANPEYEGMRCNPDPDSTGRRDY